MLYGIDIFSGAGGLSLGAEMVGIQICYGIEINPSAAKSFTRNHKGAKVLQGDIKDIDPSKLKATQPDVKKTAKVVPKATTPQVKRPYTIRRGER